MRLSTCRCPSDIQKITERPIYDTDCWTYIKNAGTETLSEGTA